MAERDLITGATGFTGRHLCRRLVAEGRKLVAFVRPTSDVDLLEGLGIECRYVDISNASAVFDSFEPFDRVYHVAAAYRTEHADRDEFTQVNVEGTRNLLEAASQAGVGRFVHASTVGVHGEIEDPPADEEYRFKPGDHYQRTKLLGEELAREYFAQGLPGTVVRPVGIYGPEDRRFLKLYRLVAGGRFVMLGDGQTLYHMTYVEDLIEGIIKAAARPEALGEAFIIAGRTYTTLWELVDLVAAALGTSVRRRRLPLQPVLLASAVCERVCRTLRVDPPIYPRRVEFFRFDRAFSIAKAERLLDYHPRVELEEGLGRTARWYQDQGLLH